MEGDLRPYLIHLNLDARLIIGVFALSLLALLFHFLHAVRFGCGLYDESTSAWAWKDGAKRSLPGRIGTVCLFVAWLGHLFWILVQLFRTVPGASPGLYEAFSGFAFFLVGAYLLLRRRWSQFHLPGLFVAAAASYALWAALSDPALHPGLVAVPPAPLEIRGPFPPLFSLSAYAVLLLAGSLELSRYLAAGTGSAFDSSYAKALAEHGRMRRDAHNLVLLGFPLLSAAIFGGAVLTQAQSATWFSGSPHERMRLVLWAGYALYLVLVNRQRWRDHRSASLQFLGLLLIWTALFFRSRIFAEFL